MGRTALGIGLACAILAACSGSSVEGYLPPSFSRTDTVAFTSDDPVSAGLAMELAKRGYRVMERARLQSFVQPHAQTRSALLKDEQYTQAGQFANVRYLISLSGVLLRRDPDKPVSVNVKILDIRSGELVGAISYTNSSTGRMGSPFDEMHKKSSSVVAREIAQYIDKLSRPSGDLLREDAGLK